MANNIENERLDQIEDHLRRLKKSDEEKTFLLLSIKAAIVGSELNGNKGLVSEVKDIEDRVKMLDKQMGEIQLYLRQSKWFIAVIITALIGIASEIFKR